MYAVGRGLKAPYFFMLLQRGFMKPLLACDTETVGLGGELLGLCFYGYNSLTDSNYGECYSLAEALEARDYIQKELFDKHCIIFHNAKYDLKILRREGFVITDYDDTMLMAHLNNAMAPCDLGTVAKRLINETKLTVGDKANLQWTAEVIEYCLTDTRLTYEVCKKLLKELEQHETHYNWYVDVELPYVEAVLEMERTGLVVDQQRTLATIDEYEVLLEGALKVLHSVIPMQRGGEVTYKRELAPGFGYHSRLGTITGNHCQISPFNPSSAAHVTNYLKSLGWEPTSFTQTGQPCTDAGTLQELKYPIVKDILRYKDYQKAISTYLVSFIEHSTPLSNQYSVVHGSFNQAGTITGRLSSSSPNLQNIWSEGPIGDTIRSLVTVPDGYDIVDIDLSNIEARVLAHYLSKCFKFTGLADRFVADEDFHQFNADCWGCSRPQAKTLLYGLLYGAGPAKIGSQLNVSVAEAKTLIEGVYRGMPIMDLKEQLWKTCRSRDGYIYTCMGRRMYYPHINSKNHESRAKAERQVFNALLQGGAADLLKVLTLKVLPKAHTYGAALAASIHDELLFYCPMGNSKKLAEILTQDFQTPLLSHCPIKGEAKIGKTWLEVH